MQVTFHECDINVEHEEMDGSPIEQYDRTSMTPRRKIRCAWEDRIVLARELIGYMIPNGPNFDWYMPHRYNHVSVIGGGNVPVMLTDLSIKGEGATNAGDASTPHNALTKYERAEFDMNYVSTPAISIDLLVEETLEPSCEFLTLSNRKIFWDTQQKEPLKTDEAPAILIKGLEWIYKIKQTPVLHSDIFNLIGRVNSQEVVSNRWGAIFAPGTLLYNPPELVEYHDFAGRTLWEVIMRFNYKPCTWDMFYKAGTKGTGGDSARLWPQPIYDNAGNRLYVYGEAGEANFNNLFLTAA